jgi:hypothetical protein
MPVLGKDPLATPLVGLFIPGDGIDPVVKLPGEAISPSGFTLGSEFDRRRDGWNICCICIT